MARAFALLSTELSDCRDDLEGLSYLELENLREWTAKFDYKYRVLGYVGGTRGDPAVAAEKKRAAAAAAAAGGGKAAAAASLRAASARESDSPRVRATAMWAASA